MKKNLIIMLVAAGTILLSSCGAQVKTVDLPETGEVDTNNPIAGNIDVEVLDGDDNQIVEVHINSKALSGDIDDWIPQILDNCEKEFVNGHLVDEGFLYWFATNYGEAAVKEIAEETLHENQDPEAWHKAAGETINVIWTRYSEQTGIEAYELTKISEKECASEDEIVISFTGDINLGDGMNTTKQLDASENGISDCLLGGLYELLVESDILMINNEFPYSDRGEPLEGKAYTFRAKMDRVSVLNDLGVDIAGIANNHMCDYGLTGVTDTVEALDSINIPHVGAGNNLEEAMTPHYFICNGRKIAFVAATQIERSYNYTKEATEETPGVLKSLNSEKFVKVIKEAKANSDYVMVFIHWGTEGSSYYEGDQVELANAFATAGADAVIGGHTHCLQGISYIGNVPVIYSLGNFWFSSTATDGVREKDTGVAQVIIDKDGKVNFKFIPCIQKNAKTYLVTEATEKQRIINWMNSYSGKAKLDEEGRVSKLD